RTAALARYLKRRGLIVSSIDAPQGTIVFFPGASQTGSRRPRAGSPTLRKRTPQGTAIFCSTWPYLANITYTFAYAAVECTVTNPYPFGGAARDRLPGLAEAGISGTGFGSAAAGAGSGGLTSASALGDGAEEPAGRVISTPRAFESPEK